MNTILHLGTEIAAVTATILAAYLTLLFYRAPGHARWLEGEAASTAVMIALMAGAIFSTAWLVEGFIMLIGDPLASLAAAAGLFAVAAWVLWKALHMKTRLLAVEQGRSPFRLGRRGRAAA